MARPIYSHEVLDPDFQWLVQNYIENHPNAIMLDSTCLPVIIILGDENSLVARAAMPSESAPQSEDTGEDPVGEETER
jgi:hypothetical protein